MSEWTGELYGFYTNKPTKSVFSCFKNEILKINYLYEYNSYNDEESLFFYKDKNMLLHHEDIGYNLDIDNKGCFCIEAKIVNLHGIAKLFEFESESNFEPYDINLQLDDIFYYVLVLPDFIENSQFCSDIHSLFVNTLERIHL
ncbi:hypothetical protein GHV27_17885 [Proteus mirabilis]|nr:hypothetical protein [Proteus mirabilis]